MIQKGIVYSIFCAGDRYMVTELKLRIGLENNKSVVTESSFTSPLKLGLPNHEDDRLKVVLMMASAGILKGDEFDYHIYCASGTKTFLTDQSYTKIFDTGDGMAKKRQNIQVKGNASLYYFPCAVIPFRGSSYEGDIMIKKGWFFTGKRKDKSNF